MLEALFPRAHARYTSLPVLGRSLEGLCVWLDARGYPRDAIGRRMTTAEPLSRALRRRGVLSLGDLTAPGLRSYAPPPRRSGAPPMGALVRSLTQYLEERGDLAPTPTTATERRVADYRRYLDRVRGFCSGTIKEHVATVSEFLRFLDYDADPRRLHEPRVSEIEAFVVKVSSRVSRGRMGPVTAALRTYLRFLATTGEGAPGLDAYVESPCLWRGERLPRALPWETVLTFLRSIDRTTPKGRRDFAMFLLVATYGLRSSEVRALALDDVAWRSRQISVPRPKVGTALVLPLTDEVAAALLDYVRHGRPASAHRRLFLRVEVPLGPLGLGAIGAAFRVWAQHAGIRPPVNGGPHCLRHSLAMHLLREGATLKTIGDILGHRSAEATGVYLRLDVDDLRDVALPLPPAAGIEEVRR